MQGELPFKEKLLRKENQSKDTSSLPNSSNQICRAEVGRRRQRLNSAINTVPSSAISVPFSVFTTWPLTRMVTS